MRIGLDPGLGDQRRGRDAQRVAFDDFEPSRPMRGDLGQRAERAGVALDGDHLLGSLRQKRARKSAGAGADLDHGDAGKRPRGAGDLAGEVEIEEEVLAQRLAGVEPVRRDHVAEAAAARPRRGSSRQSVGELERRDEARRIGDPLSGDIERRAVIGGCAHERQAERDIDAFVEGEGLRRDQALVVIHCERHIVARPRLGMEHRIGGERPDDVDSLGPKRSRSRAR